MLGNEYDPLIQVGAARSQSEIDYNSTSGYGTRPPRPLLGSREGPYSREVAGHTLLHV